MSISFRCCAVYIGESPTEVSDRGEAVDREQALNGAKRNVRVFRHVAIALPADNWVTSRAFRSTLYRLSELCQLCSGLLDVCSMLFHRLRYASALVDVGCHFLVGIHLRLYQVKCLLRKVLWNAYDAVHVGNDYVAWTYNCFLFLTVQSHWDIGLAQSALPSKPYRE